MYIFAKPSWTPEKEDATESFKAQHFSRFDTPATSGLLKFAFTGTILGSVLLMVYFYLQSRLPLPARIGYCAVMIFVIAGIGWRMTQARDQGPRLSDAGHGHA
jgi:glycerol uptake facilitator-like aquaporin